MIFNRNNNGTTEFKTQIGIMYKSISFEKISPFVKFGERDIQQLISKSVFKLIDEHYNSENYLSPGEEDPVKIFNNNLVAYVQAPVAWFSYKRFVTSNDLTHSDKGRQNFVSEGEKIAFEWQIQRDNQNLINLAHENIELLLEFLQTSIDEELAPTDENYVAKPILEAWKNSDEFKKTRQFFINTAAEFTKYYPIDNSRRLFVILIPFIDEVETDHLVSLLTKIKFDELKAQILQAKIADDATAEQIATWNTNAEIIKLCKPVVAYHTMINAIKRLSPEVFPENFFQSILTDIDLTSTTKGNLPVKDFRAEIIEYLKKDVEQKEFRLQEYLKKLDAAPEEYVPEDRTERINPDNLFVRL